MMPYIYLALAVVSSGLSGVFYKRVSALSKNALTSTLLPLIIFAPLAAVFAAAGVATGGLQASAAILLPALIAGAAAAVCSYALLESMKRNSFSIAIIIVNLSFVFPILLSMVFLQEPTGLFQLVGMCLAIVVVLLINARGGMKGSAAALLFAALSSLGNGLIDFCIKLQQHAMPGEGEASFFFFTYLFAFAFSGAAACILRLSGKKAGLKKESLKKAFLPCLGIAACNGVCFLTISLLSGTMNAAAEFTVITSLSIAVSLVIGWLRMGEKLHLREVISLIFCALAIVCQYLNLM